ncbi:MAG: GNAT family N-acetyltransferase [Lachnospiraceae bacterium]|nr:GNAT family N-acetyltransferase [Lachnospiraceae bacterium]
MMVFIEPMDYESVDELADLYVKIYKETNPKEKWNNLSAKRFILYFYNLCPDLFFVAKLNGKIIAGVWGPVKPWWDGNKVYDLEIFVDNEYQGKGVSKLILFHYLEIAIKKYNVNSIEAITFNDREFPLSYYKKIALDKDQQLVLLEGKAQEIILKLKEYTKSGM